VTHAATASNPPALGSTIAPSRSRPSHRSAKQLRGPRWCADSRLSPAIGLPILIGRGFDENRRRSRQEAAVVTREFAAKHWPDRPAIGQPFASSKTKSRPLDERGRSERGHGAESAGGQRAAAVFITCRQSRGAGRRSSCVPRPIRLRGRAGSGGGAKAGPGPSAVRRGHPPSALVPATMVPAVFGSLFLSSR
jgi:hypothetical protein